MSYYEKEFEKLSSKYKIQPKISCVKSSKELKYEDKNSAGDNVYVGRGENGSKKFPKINPPYLNRKSVRLQHLHDYIASSGESEYSTPIGRITPGNTPESEPKITNQLCKAENIHDQSKKKLRTQKALTCLLYAAMKYQSEKIQDLDRYITHKRKECTTRKIQQVIILSSYKQAREHLCRLNKERLEFHCKLESINLQLQVTRHMQHNEQENHFDLTRKIETLEIELSNLKKALIKTKGTYNEYQEIRDKTYEERKKLLDEKARLRIELTMLASKCDLIQGSIDLERKRSEKYVNDNRLFRNQLNSLYTELREAHDKKDICQEELRQRESENWELQLQCESKDHQLMDLENALSSISYEINRIFEENKDLTLRNELLEKSLELHQKEVILKQSVLVSTETNYKEQENTLVLLQDEANELSIENEALRTEIYSYKLKNLRKRRQWVRIIALITTPFVGGFSLIGISKNQNGGNYNEVTSSGSGMLFDENNNRYIQF